jgi:hypothetical protein
MKDTKRTFVGVVVVALLAIGVCATTPAAMEETTVTGYVWAQDWDENFQATAATIVTQEGEQFLIVDDAKGKELFKLDAKKVKIAGILEKIDSGKRAITVSSYKIIQEDSD